MRVVVARTQHRPVSPPFRAAVRDEAGMTSGKAKKKTPPAVRQHLRGQIYKPLCQQRGVFTHAIVACAPRHGKRQGERCLLQSNLAALSSPYPDDAPRDALAGGASPSLDVYRQSHTDDGASGRKKSGLNNGISLEVQAKICCDPWAVRHRFVHPETGLVAHASCGRYACLYCGPRRVSMWRAVIERAGPERFVTLSRVGDTLAVVRRVSTTIVHALRRKGYRFEYCATFEQHRMGAFHIHMLQRGDFIPQAILSDALRSATHGYSWITDIRRCKPGSAGYVTKYCTKMLAASDVGRKPDGTRPRVNRVRYSRHFFPSAVADLREQLRAEWSAKRAQDGEPVIDLDGEWVMQEAYPLPRDVYGRIDDAAAAQQYRDLVAERYEAATLDARKASRGDLVVLRFMLGDELAGAVG